MEERQDGHPDGVEHFHPDAPVGSGGLVEFLDAGGQLGVALGQPTLGVAVAWLLLLRERDCPPSPASVRTAAR
jgi:hypothetical protein